MEKYCKILTTYFGPRIERTTKIAWPCHGQLGGDAASSLDNLKFVVNIEHNLDAGVEFDTIIVNNDFGYDDGKKWLDSIDGTDTKNGKIHVIHRENEGKNFAAYREGYENFKDNYDYFMFIPDDYVLLAENYYKSTLDQYEYDIKNKNVAAISMSGLGKTPRPGGNDNNLNHLHAHDGICLIHKRYIEENIKKYGPLPSSHAESYIAGTARTIGGHIVEGEIPFTNRYVTLGYQLSAFNYIDLWFADRLPIVQTWPITDNENQIYLVPIYNLLAPGSDINLLNYTIDDSILSILKERKNVLHNTMA